LLPWQPWTPSTRKTVIGPSGLGRASGLTQARFFRGFDSVYSNRYSTGAKSRIFEKIDETCFFDSRPEEGRKLKIESSSGFLASK